MTRLRPRRPGRPLRLAVLACTVLLVGLAAGSLVLVFRGSGPAEPPAGTKGLSAKASLSSRSVLFGDTVEARLDLVVPRSMARTVFRGHPNFHPFQILSNHVERADLGGGLERISLRYELTCVTRQCLAAEPIVNVQFAPASIAIPGGSLHADWPPLAEVSRAPGLKTPVTDGLAAGPAVIPGLQPRRNAYEALGAAGGSLLLLLAGWLVVRERARRRRLAAARRGTLLQALLARVEAGLPEDVIYRQRHALDALAVELRHRHIDGGLSDVAERLAWAPEEPDPAEIRALCTQIRRLAKT